MCVRVGRFFIFFLHMHAHSSEDRAADVQEVNGILERNSEKAFAQGFVFQRQESD